MAITSNTIANQALIIAGGSNQPLIVGEWPNFAETGNGSTAAKAANQLYGTVIQTVGRQFEWDFARRTIALVLSGNIAPFPWDFEYLYPTNGIEVWNILPSSGDPLDPLPYNFQVANVVVGAAIQKVIQADLADALVIYNNNPNESTWDPGFREAAVRLLASEFASAVFGKPDLSQMLLQSASSFESVGEARRD